MAALGPQHTNRFTDSNPTQAPPVTQSSESAERLHAGSHHWTAAPAVASTNATASKSYSKIWSEQPKTSLEQQNHNSKNPRDVPHQ
ncbi:hypothetical protein Nepgr_033792 [Nepenthes gracilis]|uniref:Uncharacterized protein n=1 Tax=Nepenthes gracilis TaxID=150966 RepID=A0AAD3Y774_NEPGR|nr:hypothetical protein Nepgr_033792 [Nepenthes gracilis]